MNRDSAHMGRQYPVSSRNGKIQARGGQRPIVLRAILPTSGIIPA